MVLLTCEDGYDQSPSNAKLVCSERYATEGKWTTNGACNEGFLYHSQNFPISIFLKKLIKRHFPTIQLIICSLFEQSLLAKITNTFFRVNLNFGNSSGRSGKLNTENLLCFTHPFWGINALPCSEGSATYCVHRLRSVGSHAAQVANSFRPSRFSRVYSTIHFDVRN